MAADNFWMILIKEKVTGRICKPGYVSSLRISREVLVCHLSWSPVARIDSIAAYPPAWGGPPSYAGILGIATRGVHGRPGHPARR